MKRSIRLIVASELIILLTYFISLEFYLNLQVAFLSSFFVILGSSYAYKKMIIKDGASDMFEGKRELLEVIEDPHELYEENDINDAPFEELDLKAIVKEEKKKIKTFSLASMKKGAKGSTSAFRLLPYLFLVLGFIALANNEMLNLAIYLPSLLVGIVVGYLLSKEMT
ncbi:hypothetical protein M947_10750 [Sulfurimonas hongkongensis]|uniref:Uncharacterized protein n=1 Tax=Sulfurimonas hongkongensis TaxID=1172190 RepID=T0JCA7_9BACT|nr:hypothetical protein [Sulfurimonas hongkongensis]EQB34477.1 hypothetical protein M947_10750 [Sulfurimonas hongkongensis]